jgi:hypothetical protein
MTRHDEVLTSFSLFVYSLCGLVCISPQFLSLVTKGEKGGRECAWLRGEKAKRLGKLYMKKRSWPNQTRTRGML